MFTLTSLVGGAIPAQSYATHAGPSAHALMLRKTAAALILMIAAIAAVLFFWRKKKS
jgi:hypothetical protein